MDTQYIDSAIAVAYNEAQRYQALRNDTRPRPEIDTEALRLAFDIGLPDAGREPSDVIRLLNEAAIPGLVGSTSAGFFGWVMGASSQVGVAADILTSTWGQNAGIYQTSPSAAVAEEVSSSWLLDLLDLPKESSVGFTTGATMASFIGLAAARIEVLDRQGWNFEVDGMIGAPPVRVIVSEEAHASVLAVLGYLGFGQRNLIRIPTDEQGRMDVDEMEAVLKTVNGACIIVAQAGHINSGAFDRLDVIGELARRHDAWFHIDGAFGLWARCSPHYRELAQGAELADSWAVDGHKWLQVPYDSGYAIVRNSAAHRRAMSINASYLNHAVDDGRNPSDYCPELSRRARGFTTWAVLQMHGRQGVREMLERHCECAQQLQKLLENEPGVRVMNSVCLNQLAVTFEISGDHRISEVVGDHSPQGSVNAISTDAVIARVQKENISFVSGADWRGHRIMRVSVISEHTGIRDIERLAISITKAWRAEQKVVRQSGGACVQQ